ncbi:hypothetical protein B0H67DRAFT_359410 [Lasiosphaeris hirsuta]|uniref:Secreted protein n=1 Tax=Lasiosphaeris hirsuta TaxID=260670 RepID=A0AA40DKM9_9PEZI|nr:hypothetical protein B0H67DRAFT_359410 [Lasiosphaeris hirsuta]
MWPVAPLSALSTVCFVNFGFCSPHTAVVTSSELIGARLERRLQSVERSTKNCSCSGSLGNLGSDGVWKDWRKMCDAEAVCEPFWESRDTLPHVHLPGHSIQVCPIAQWQTPWTAIPRTCNDAVILLAPPRQSLTTRKDNA